MRWLWCGLIMLSCGAPSLASPELTSHPTSALEEVTYPPPPARPETIPPKPNTRAVWLDGEWVWQARRWAWRPGRWVAPPPGGRYAPWTAVRDRAGTLYIARGAWRDASGKEIAEPEALAIAGAPAPNIVVAPQGGGPDERDTEDAGADAAFLGSSADAGPIADAATTMGAEP